MKTQNEQQNSGNTTKYQYHILFNVFIERLNKRCIRIACVLKHLSVYYI